MLRTVAMTAILSAIVLPMQAGRFAELESVIAEQLRTTNTPGAAVAVIEGDVVSQNADVSGNIRGKINVTELLFLKSTANMMGDIVTGKLVVEVGATDE